MYKLLVDEIDKNVGTLKLNRAISIMSLTTKSISNEDLAISRSHTMNNIENKHVYNKEWSVAAMKCDKEKLNSMLTKDPSLVNYIDPIFSLSALHWASKSENINVMKLLVSYRANINIENWEGITPLHLAYFYRRRKSIEYLLDHSDIEPEIRDIHNYTPDKYTIKDNRSLIHNSPKFFKSQFLPILFRTLSLERKHTKNSNTISSVRQFKRRYTYIFL